MSRTLDSAIPLVSISAPMKQPSTIVHEGWVLKKRRKKMQGMTIVILYQTTPHEHTTPGFARRYFVLHQSGVLLYSFGPGKPARDQITLSRAAISSAQGRKDIHIDSNNATFHIKCLSMDDFNSWMAAIRFVLVLCYPCLFTDESPLADGSSSLILRGPPLFAVLSLLTGVSTSRRQSSKKWAW